MTWKIICRSYGKRVVVLPGISMEGDDELLADMDIKEEPKRDEWMTTLPPERKVKPHSISILLLYLS